MTTKQTQETHLAIFKNKKIRKIIHENEWYFSVIDVVAALTESANPRDYWFKIKTRVADEEKFQLSTICRQLKLEAPDQKLRETNCANTEGIFRIIQSIPSPKAEPFKRWLAKVGFERVQEIENPELATKRTRTLYKLKGYSDDWIEKRMRGIAIREELTDEWKNRGAEENRDFEILTAEISKATFGLTPSEYKEHKGLKRQNLRDHKSEAIATRSIKKITCEYMDDFELIFTMLGERSTTEIHRNENSRGVKKLKEDSKIGGKIAGNARKELEKKLGRSVVSKKNFLAKKSNKTSVAIKEIF
jgi:prophage antirepressor-like protein